jgi:hypothetical protein
MRELTDVFKDTPKAFSVLHDIQKQFRTDSGSSLRDVVNDLQKSADEQKVSAGVLKIGVETSRVLAEQDRVQLQRLIGLLQGLSISVEQGTAVGLRSEAAAKGVAEDLANAHNRADLVDSDEHGAAADAAAKPTKTEKRLAK